MTMLTVIIKIKITLEMYELCKKCSIESVYIVKCIDRIRKVVLAHHS